MIRFPIGLLFFITGVFTANAQKGWQLEVMPGLAVYRGDLSQGSFSFKSVGPGAVVDLKYDFGDMLALRAGLGWGVLEGDDKDNKKESVRSRNLSFKSNIIEFGLTAEVTFLDPETYAVNPYLLTGVGLFHFDPYAYDKNNKKTRLQPLSTEGQGFPEYPDRKKYALTQAFIPFGGGLKINVKGKYAISFEGGVRFLFTDYLDDVSSTYINPAILLQRKGQEAVDLAFRQTPRPNEGERRGNSESNDFYFMGGFKFSWFLSKKKTP